MSPLMLSSLASRPPRPTCLKHIFARRFRPTLDVTQTPSARSALIRFLLDPQLPSNTSQYDCPRKAGLYRHYSSNTHFLSSSYSLRNLHRNHKDKFTIDVVQLLQNPQQQVALWRLRLALGFRRMVRLGQLVKSLWRASRRRKPHSANG